MRSWASFEPPSAARCFWTKSAISIPAIQPKLLRFLESAEIHPIGELKPQRVAVRIVAATNADLDERWTSSGSGAICSIGSASRSWNCRRFANARTKFPRSPRCSSNATRAECHRTGLRLGDDLIAALLLYDWPGNIRQLSNEIRRVVAMADDGQRLRCRRWIRKITRNWNARTPAPAPRRTTRTGRQRPAGPAARAGRRRARAQVHRSRDGGVERPRRRRGTAARPVAQGTVPETTPLGLRRNPERVQRFLYRHQRHPGRPDSPRDRHDVLVMDDLTADAGRCLTRSPTSARLNPLRDLFDLGPHAKQVAAPDLARSAPRCSRGARARASR